MNLGAGLIIKRNRGHILIVRSGDGHGIVLQVYLNILNLRYVVINDHGCGEGSPFAQGIPVHVALGIHIVLGNQGHGEFQKIVGGSALGNKLDTQLIAGVVPGTANDIIVSGVSFAGVHIHQDLTGGFVHSHKPGGGSIPDGGKDYGVDRVPILTVDGIAFRHICIVRDEGIAAKVISLCGIPAIGNNEGVGILVAQVRHTVFLAVVVFHAGAHIKHGRVGPITIETQYRDGVHSALDSLSSGYTLNEDIAFNVGAVGIVFLDLCSCSIRQSNVDGHTDRAIGRNLDSIIGAGEEGIGIVGVNVSIIVQVRMAGIGQLGDQTGGVVQQRHTIGLVHCAVIVEVQAQISVSAQNRTVDRKGGGDVNGFGPGIHIVCHLIRAFIAVGIILEVILDEEVRVEIVEQVFIDHIVNCEGEAVRTGAVRVIAQLRLDLAIGVGVCGVLAHQNVRIRRDCQTYIPETRTLLNHRVVAIGAAIDHGNSSGHQKAVGQGTNILVGSLLKVCLAGILGKHRSHTSNLRSGHRGAVHQLILVKASAIGGLTVDGVDAATGGGDFRLQLQTAGHAPTGERAHGIVIAVELTCSNRIIHGDLSGVVQDTSVLIHHRGSSSLHFRAVRLGDGSNGFGVGVTG